MTEVPCRDACDMRETAAVARCGVPSTCGGVRLPVEPAWQAVRCGGCGSYRPCMLLRTKLCLSALPGLILYSLASSMQLPGSALDSRRPFRTAPQGGLHCTSAHVRAGGLAAVVHACPPHCSTRV